MGLLDGSLVHTVVRVRPVVTTDAHGAEKRDYDAGARVTLAPGSANGGAWLQQDQRADRHMDGREPQDQMWLLMCTYADIASGDRIEWADHPAGPVAFDVVGPPEPAYDLASSTFDHLEATLRVVDG